ncbi:MAG TPA: AMP-binding protein [Acidimicrobiales bacterium]|nr:AMP-binding protein [Acidimicrobiales bacterium]
MLVDSDLGLSVPPERLTLGAFMEDIAARFADNEAMVLGDRRVSYRQLAEESRAVAKALLAAGVPKGAKVGLLVGNRPEFVSGAFGAAMVGAVVIPVSTFATAPERHHIMRHSDMTLLVVEDHMGSHRYLEELETDHPELVAGPAGRIRSVAFPFLRRLVTLDAERPGVETWDDFLAAGQDIGDDLLGAAAAEVLPYDDAMIIYTSGTTAEPKAVLHTQRSVTAMLWRWGKQMELDPTDRVWSVFPFFWTAGFAMVLAGTLAAGASLVLQEGFDAGEALALMERERVTAVHTFPHTEAQLVDHPDARRRDLSALTKVRPSSPLGQLVGAKTAPDAWDLRSGYGASETFTISTALPADAPLDLRLASHGLPLPGMRIRIVDTETGEPLAPGESGEITVKGVTLMRTYYKVAPEKALDDEGWYHSGDAGHLDDQGYLHWHGRISGLIKTGGSNVSPVEVETRASEVEGVGVVSVIGVPHPMLGEAVVMCVVPLRDVELDLDALGRHLRATLATYKVPRRVLLFEDGELSFTSSDKVVFDELRQLAARRLVETDDDADWVACLEAYLKEASHQP